MTNQPVTAPWDTCDRMDCRTLGVCCGTACRDQPRIAAHISMLRNQTQDRPVTCTCHADGFPCHNCLDWITANPSVLIPREIRAMLIPDRCAALEAELARERENQRLSRSALAGALNRVEALTVELGYERQRNTILKTDNNELRDALVALRLLHRDLVQRCAERDRQTAAFTDPDDPAPPVRTLPARAYRQPRKAGWEAMR